MSQEKLRFFTLSFLLILSPALCRFVVEKNNLKVTSPDSIKGVYECAIGNFGVPQYGGTLVGTVAYPKSNQKACKSYNDFDISFKSKPGGLPTFVLIDRGGSILPFAQLDCFFTLKAWIAQQAGAAAILVADNKAEPLITMDTPEEDKSDADYLQNITIPSALITKSLGDSIKSALSGGDMVNMKLDWTESVPHPDERVEYELWTNSNDQCGKKCDTQIEFLKNFKGAAQILEKGGHTQFTPHYITWYCPEAFTLSKQCKSQCINHGRYCAPDPEQDFTKGYDGKDVVVQNLRQACVYRVMNETGKPWVWWDYVTDFAIRCPMKDKKYTKECADEIIKSLGEYNASLPCCDIISSSANCFFTLKAWIAQQAGAAAILVADNKAEPLITMDTPEEDKSDADYLQNITIPSALITKSLGDSIKSALSGGDMVNMKLDWTESVPHPDERVEYELWTNSNDQCGKKCDTQIEFLKNFKGAAQILEKGGHTQFTPHYITWYCPEAFTLSKQCKSQCINHGRYCAPDPEQDFTKGYDGKDVVVQNLRQACVYRVMNETGKPWVWWDYVTDFAIRCPMKDKKYTKECADEIIKSLDIDLKKVDKCIGDPDADVENPVLKAEQESQIGKGARGDVTILPTLVVNNRQYRGKLEKGAVLKAMCSGFEESTEPAICLTEDLNTNECLENNGGCWQDKAANITACRDTFRGRLCECPTVQGVKFSGDGYTHCKASGALHCGINNGGCWRETRGSYTYSACVDDHSNGCKCPLGFKGDGVKSCEGSNKVGTTKLSWSFLWFLIIAVGVAGLSGYAAYKYRIRRYMDAEIRGIMAQYMPLESQPNPRGPHMDI
ncbi:hypothetical protein DY000_02061183 [Brassica cretica]|uniref:EGF-like calcium-binding domain-containing protein n=1 Tax=Brassica cretica TaxID=69181 RepID=A0ABQ7APG3_BRACR|nr:hypothetical protein DY000_02061183 [Brassica cretica]